jgi:hypothetical protein
VPSGPDSTTARYYTCSLRLKPDTTCDRAKAGPDVRRLGAVVNRVHQLAPLRDDLRIRLEQLRTARD